MNFTDDNFVTIQGWMRTGLGLKGNDLLVYAAIYGFSQKEDQWFTGGQQYLAELCGSPVRTIRRNLKNLEELGLIEATFSDTDARFNKYRATAIRELEDIMSPNKIEDNLNKKEDIMSPIENEIEDISNTIEDTMSPNRGHNVRQNINKYKNINNNSLENKKNKNTLSAARAKEEVFIPPTVEDVRAYCTFKGFIFDPEEFVDFYAGKGWMVGQNKVVDWKSVANNFERKKRKDLEKEQKTQAKKKTALEEWRDL